MEKGPLSEHCGDNIAPRNKDCPSKKEKEDTPKKPDKENYHDAVEYMDFSETEYERLSPIDQQELPVDETYLEYEEPPVQPTDLKVRKSLLAKFDPLYESEVVVDLNKTHIVQEPSEVVNIETNCTEDKQQNLFGDSTITEVISDSSNEFNEEVKIEDTIVELIEKENTDLNETNLDKLNNEVNLSTTITDIVVGDSHLNEIIKRTSTSDESNIENVAGDIVNDIVTEAVETVQSFEPNVPSPHILLEAMADVHDKLALQEEENGELKLQLNASQQVRAALELQLRQKEEIIIKSQAELTRKEQAFKLEMKQLQEKLEKKLTDNDNSSQTKDLQEMLKAQKVREAQLISEINARKNDEANYRKIMDEYDKTIGTQLADHQKLKEEHEIVKRHLANLELAFSDVHQKYERSKKIIDGYKCNEDALRQTLVLTEDNVIKSEEKYESLKAHAKAQIGKSNQEIQLLREQYESEFHKLSAIIKRLEIKNASLAESLDQKTKECSALAALCDEVTGKV